MKQLIVLFLLLAFSPCCSAQFFKKLAQKTKDEIDYRVHRKAGQKIDEGIDTLLNVPKKIVEKNKDKNKVNSSPNTTEASKTASEKVPNSTPPNDAEDMTPKDGYIKFTLSAATIFSGGNITISGSSILYKSYKEVEVSVNGPDGKNQKLVPLNANGMFTSAWYAPAKAGSYTITVRSSDKKATQSAKITVFELAMLDNWCSGNIDLTKKAYDKLKDRTDKVKNEIGSKDKAELDKKLADVKDKVDKVVKLFTDLNTAGKEIAALAKSGKHLSPNLADNLSELNNNLEEQRKKMQLLAEYDDHQPADNTICEYLVMLNEACAAFSVYSNIESKALVTIIGNIQLDKVVPKAVSMVNEKQQWLSEPNDFAIKEPAKIFATAAVDAKSLSSNLGVMGFAGDMVQFATDFLLKKYCGVFKGTFTHNYTVEFRNDKSENWWTYGVDMRAVVALRYPKQKDGVNLIKMKGNLEGNATKFSFFEDVEKNDDFHKGSKGKIEVVPLKTFMPLGVSFATSERDILGFGAIARGLATPAYFNIPIDAEYDVNADKIKIFMNPAIVDFTPYVSNVLLFALVGGDLLPYLKTMVFPIHKAAVTIGSVVRSHNEFDIVKDKKGGLGFSGKANKHLGSKTAKIEHDLNFTIEAKKE